VLNVFRFFFFGTAYSKQGPHCKILYFKKNTKQATVHKIGRRKQQKENCKATRQEKNVFSQLHKKKKHLFMQLHNW
jgi:hypothetical protein